MGTMKAVAAGRNDGVRTSSSTDPVSASEAVVRTLWSSASSSPIAASIAAQARSILQAMRVQAREAMCAHVRRARTRAPFWECCDWNQSTPFGRPYCMKPAEGPNCRSLNPGFRYPKGCTEGSVPHNLETARRIPPDM